MICTRCLNGRHARCEDRIGCTCSVCAARPRSVPKKAAPPAPSESKPRRPARESRVATRAPRIPKPPKIPAPPRDRITGPGTECTVDGCTENVDSRGWCSVHYRRWRRHGDPLYEVERAPFVFRDSTDVELIDVDLIPRLPGCEICGQRHGHWPGCPKG